MQWTGPVWTQQIRFEALNSGTSRTSQIRFPKNCVVDLHGLITHYTRDPDAVLTFLTCALAQCTKWAWTIGYYDTAHQSMLATLKHQDVQRQGHDQEQLDIAMHVTPNPPSETELD